MSNNDNSTPIKLNKLASSKAKKHTRVRISEYGRSEIGDLYVYIKIIQGRPIKGLWSKVNDLFSSRDDAFDILNRAGANIYGTKAKRELKDRIRSKIPRNTTVQIATRVGWFGNCFVFPNEIIGKGKSSIRSVLPPNSLQYTAKFRCGGTLDGAKKLMNLAHGNSRFMLAVCVALTGPLSDLLGQSQIAIQLFGPAGTAKTALLVATSSIWGRHLDPNLADILGSSNSWNMTDNNSEELATGHSHTALFLDEANAMPMQSYISRLKSTLSFVFRLDGSQAKGRHNSPARSTWKMGILSTANFSLSQLAQQENKTITNAERDRLIDIPVPDKQPCIFETLHGYRSLTSFAKEIIKISSTNYGTIAREFIRQVCDWKDSDKAGLQDHIDARKTAYLRAADKARLINPDTERLTNKFSSLYAAGCLAIRFKLVPWTKGELRQALFNCQIAHVAHTAEIQSQDPGKLLYDFVDTHREKFIEYDKTNIFNNRQESFSGFASDKRGEIMIPEKQFSNIYSFPAAATQAKVQLARDGIIKSDKSGKYVIKKFFSSEGGKRIRKYVIVIDAEALGARYKI